MNNCDNDKKINMNLLLEGERLRRVNALKNITSWQRIATLVGRR